MELVTGRLRVRDFRANDVHSVHGYAGDHEVLRYMDLCPSTVEDCAAFLRSAVDASRENPRTRYALGIASNDDDVVIGSVELRVTSSAHKRAVLGYILARRHWGHGYATEAADALLRFGLGELGLHKVTAMCDPENVASARVLHKISMRYEGRLRDHVLIDGEWRDRLIFAALAGRAPSLTGRAGGGTRER